jgi:hypothetical protein
MSVNPTRPGLAPLPINVPLVDKQGNQAPVWQAWFNSVYTWCVGNGQSGTTTQRPTYGLFIGRQYFDTTLGYMVAVKTVSPSVVWVNGAGTPV